MKECADDRRIYRKKIIRGEFVSVAEVQSGFNMLITIVFIGCSMRSTVTAWETSLIYKVECRFKVSHVHFFYFRTCILPL